MRERISRPFLALHGRTARPLHAIVNIESNSPPKALSLARRVPLVVPLLLIFILSGCKHLPDSLGGDNAARDYRFMVGGLDADSKKLRAFEKRVQGDEWKATKAKRTGWRLQREGKIDEAIGFYREALSYNEEDVEAMSYLGLLN